MDALDFFVFYIIGAVLTMFICYMLQGIINMLREIRDELKREE